MLSTRNIPSRFQELRGKWIPYFNSGMSIPVLVLKAEWSDQKWTNMLTEREAYTVKLKVQDKDGNVFYTKPYPSGVYVPEVEVQLT